MLLAAITLAATTVVVDGLPMDEVSRPTVVVDGLPMDEVSRPGQIAKPPEKRARILRTSLPYVAAVGADWYTSEMYMRQFATGWTGHEANPLARSFGGRLLGSTAVVASMTYTDIYLQRRGHRTAARVLRCSVVGVRLLISIRTWRMSR